MKMFYFFSKKGNKNEIEHYLLSLIIEKKKKKKKKKKEEIFPESQRRDHQSWFSHCLFPPIRNICQDEYKRLDNLMR